MLQMAKKQESSNKAINSDDKMFSVFYNSCTNS